MSVGAWSCSFAPCLPFLFQTRGNYPHFPPRPLEQIPGVIKCLECDQTKQPCCVQLDLAICAHLIGQEQCFLFCDRIYSNGTDIDAGFASTRRRQCPQEDQNGNLAPLDLVTPNQLSSSIRSSPS
ncbi:hypothetical protein MTR67_047591 [Solanum verrucosum]|uniref:Plant heme peroxidase family profile domain-containing protein n=1 Tax=Solanum verrucosum TaxID=315347 RepID=A0AAF0V017_SOLVR|nr:hypothetical protein MTR67_047591 [Solanum verrucosum]